MPLDPAAKRPRLADYDDYRAYLRDVIDDAAHSGEGQSLTRFARAFGLSRSHLSMVLSGERGLSLANIHRVAATLQLKLTDHEYWEALVLFGQAKDEHERAYYRSRLGKARTERTTTAINSASRTLVSAWYIPALLVYLIDLAKDEAEVEANLPKIAAHLQLPLATVKETIDRLQAEGLLAYRDRGAVHVSFNRLTTLVSNKRFLKQAFAEGLRRVDEHFNSPLCFFNGMTLSVAEADIERFIADYKTLLDRYVSASDQEPVDRVVQVNIQLFPVL